MNTPSELDETRLPILDEVGAELNRLFQAREARERRFRPRLPIRFSLRARVLLPIAAVLVAAGAATAAVKLAPGPKPIHAGKVTQCPPDHNYMASTKTGLVFPQNYPPYKGTGLTSWSVVRCFASLQQAIDAGYKVAGVPPGYTTVHGVYFTKSPADVRAACSRARRVVNAPVFCPTVLPSWQDDSSPHPYGEAPDCPSKGCEHPILSITGIFFLPDAFSVSDGGGDVDASIWAISSQQETEPATIGLVGCPDPTLRSRTAFRGHPAGWYTCPDQESAGTDTLFQWSIGQEHYGIMLSGASRVRKQLAEYIAVHLVEDQPRA